MAALELLDRVFKICEMAFQAGDHLVQPRFCTFDIEGGLRVMFCHGSLNRRCAQTALLHRHVDYAAAPSRTLSVILRVSGKETTGCAPLADITLAPKIVRLATNFQNARNSTDTCAKPALRLMESWTEPAARPTGI